MSAATPAEWASAVSLGLSAISLVGLALAFADADGAYFDPRPAVRRAHQAVARALRDAAISLAALLMLLMLLTSSAPEATR